MRRYRLSSHAKYDLKVHVVWCPKYRKRVLTGQVATRVRDLLRQIAAENELQIISGKVAADHVHMRSSTGEHLWARGYFAVTSGTITHHYRRDDQRVHQRAGG